MGNFKVGLIGCGGMGTCLAKACNALDNADLAAVYDANDAAAGKLAEDLGARKYTSYDELMDNVDGVIIATPNDSHAPLTIEAAEKGKHVFCEKPMSLSVDDCDAMICAADQAGVKLMVGQVLRLIGPFWKSAQVIESGEIGRPFAMAVTRLAGIQLFADGWRATRKQCGGVLYEVHVHELDFMRRIMGEATSVFASTGHFTSAKAEYEDVAFVQMRYKSGGIGTLHCGISSSIDRYEMMIQCEEGTLTNGGFSGPIQYSRFGQEISSIELSDIQKENPHQEEIRAWVDAATKDTPMPFDGRDGRAAVELCEAAYRSAFIGDVVHLPMKSRG